MQTLVNMARHRAAAYGFFALAYHFPPDERLQASLAEWRATPFVVSLSNHERSLLDRLAALAAETPADALRLDFDSLFQVPGSRYVTPYESVYADPPVEANGKRKARTCGPSTLGVSCFYDRVGLAVSRDYKELRDYVGLEMACMEYLATREAEAAESADEAAAAKCRAWQRSFLVDHLGRWVPAFAAATAKKAGTDFYRTLADLTAAWLAAEGKALCPEA